MIHPGAVAEGIAAEDNEAECGYGYAECYRVPVGAEVDCGSVFNRFGYTAAGCNP